MRLPLIARSMIPLKLPGALELHADMPPLPKEGARESIGEGTYDRRNPGFAGPSAPT